MKKTFEQLIYTLTETILHMNTLLISTKYLRILMI